MKKLLAYTVLAGCLFSQSMVFAAANPFSDVQPDHWSYIATKDLVKAGIVDDYNNSMFEKNRRIARYALVQLVGQAVYRINEAGPKEQELIRKLAEEYKDDLSRVGAGVAEKDTQTGNTGKDEELAARVEKLEKSTIGIKDLKISGFLQTENSYGRRYNKDDAKHEYELEARIQFDKKIDDKLTYTHQIATKTYLDAYSAAANDNFGQEFPNSNKEKLYTRLAYLSWQPDKSTNVQVGKMAVWLAGGLLGDDYVKGAIVSHETSTGYNFTLLGSRYASGTNWPGMTVIEDGSGGYKLYRGAKDRNIWYAGVSKGIGKVNVGVHYLGANSSFVSDDNVNIYAVTADTEWKKVNWTVGYAENTSADNKGSLYKLQAIKNFDSKNQLILQYWRNEQNINMPLEHGNHMAFWTDTYTNKGLRGARAIYAVNFTDNILMEVFYGYYKNLVDSKSANKYGFATTVTF